MLKAVSCSGSNLTPAPPPLRTIAHGSKIHATKPTSFDLLTSGDPREESFSLFKDTKKEGDVFFRPYADADFNPDRPIRALAELTMRMSYQVCT